MTDEQDFSPASNSSPLEEGLKLRQYWAIALERRWLIIATFAIIVLLSTIYAFRSIPIYQASARLQIEKESGGLLKIAQNINLDAGDRDYLQTQYRNLASRTLIEDVVHRENLDTDSFFLGADSDLTKAVGENIEVAPVRTTRLVDVKVTHPKPDRAAQIANALVRRFMEQNIERKRQKADDVYRLLKQEVDEQENKLEEAKQAVQKYMADKKAVSLKDEFNIANQGLKDSRFKADQAAADAANLQKSAEEAEKWKLEGKRLADLPLMAKDDLMNSNLKQLSLTENALSELLTRFKDRHPRVIAARAAVVSAQEAVEQRASYLYSSLQEDARILKLKADESKLRQIKAEDEILELNKLQIQYDLLDRQAARAQFMYDQLLGTMKEASLNSRDTIQNMTLIDEAVPPSRPIRPNKGLILLVGIVGGLAGALALAFLINYLDDSIKSQEDVETYLRLPFLGYITNIKSTSVVERDLQAHLAPTSSTAEAFRTLRAAVSLARNADKLRVIAVTSTIPSEGKSLVASNFAIVTAQTGLKTLLIDADLRRPSVHKAFQLQSPIGLSSYLAERVSNVTEFIHPTDVLNLDVVCCGATPSNPSELIGSKRMLQFLEEVATRYDRVVLDCPPVSAVADPLIVGAMCDGMIFVTKFNKIRREHALRSVQRLQDAGIHIIGLVLNDIDFEGKDSYYYSYHYYQNRYYASHYRSKATENAKEIAEEAGKKKSGKS